MQSVILASTFDDLADTYDHQHHDTIAQELISWVTPRKDDTVADVACGAGAVALQLARSRPDSAPPIIAIDVSPGMIAAGKTRASALVPGTAIDWQVGNALPLPVADCSLDVVLCTSSLHFLGQQALVDWKRALRPGGRVGFTLPLATHFRPSEQFSRHFANDVPLPYTPSEASTWAEENGFIDAISRIHILGTRRIVMTLATRPALK